MSAAITKVVGWLPVLLVVLWGTAVWAQSQSGGQGQGRSSEAPKSAVVTAGDALQVPRQVQQEERLAPKEQRDFDDIVGETRGAAELQAEQEAAAGLADALGPGLTAGDLEARKREEILDAKLDEELALATQLLEYETECEALAPVEFRVADLYWEKAKRLFFRANDFSLPELERKRFGRQNKQAQQLALRHYQAVLDRCAEAPEVPQVLFEMGRAYTELEKPEDGAVFFKRIIQDHADTQWLGQAWFMIGEYYFNTVQDAHKALRAYGKTITVADDTTAALATYKQGWCYINLGDWDLAQERFEKVVNLSRDPKNSMGDKSRKSLRKEALRDYVRVYANVGKAREALRIFRKLGGDEEAVRMMETLGGWYIKQGANPDIVTVYRNLIKYRAKSSRVPLYQGHIVDATSRAGDKRLTVKQAKLLTTYFEIVRKRAASGLSADQALTVAQDLSEAEVVAENTLRRLALEYHKEGKKLHGRARDGTFSYAQELYRHYLAVFPEPRPDADVNYVLFMRFYYAEILYTRESFLQAARNYDRVVDMIPKSEREENLVVAAAEEAVRAYDELVRDLDRAKPPKIGGSKPKLIPPIKVALINACERYIDKVGDRGDKIVAIRYKMARIYYTYNHWSKAAPAFADIVTGHPDNKVACYSANLSLDIYNGLKDYRSLADYSRLYAAHPRLACEPEDRARFAKILEQASFFVVKTEFEDKKLYAAAASSYMDFYNEFSKSQFADEAVYNAAVNYDLANQLDKANEVRQFLVDKLPESPFVPDTLFHIAQSYERVVDFMSSASYFENFALRYPKDERSKNAIYNVGLYRATLGDYGGAKKARERYLKLYPKADDAHEVAFAICETLEEEALAGVSSGQLGQSSSPGQPTGQPSAQASNPTILKSAHDCYLKFVGHKVYSKTDIDLLCQAQFRRTQILEALNDKQGASDVQNYLTSNWARWSKGASTKGSQGSLPRCSRAIAEIKFKGLAANNKKYRELRIAELNPTDKGKRRFDRSIKSKTKARDRLIQAYKEVVGIGVAQWALAALYRIGESYQESIDSLLAAKIPNKIPGYTLTEDDKGVLRNQLQTMAKPIEGLALEAFQVCVSKANELGVYNDWSNQALDALQRLQPEAYPLVVEVLPEVTVKQPLALARNGIVLPDGDTTKGVRVTYQSK